MQIELFFRIPDIIVNIEINLTIGDLMFVDNYFLHQILQ